MKTEWQPSVVDNILNLDAQAAEPSRRARKRSSSTAIGRLDALKQHRSDSAYRAAEERIELAQAAAIFRRLKRELGVIDFGDQIELAMRRRHRSTPMWGASTASGSQAVLLDEYQDTNVAQARLLEALFGGGHPVTAVGDPDQNIYAWRGASLYNLLEFPRRFRRRDGDPAARDAAVHQLPSRVPRILRAADTHHRRAAGRAASGPGQTAGPVEANGAATVTLASHRDELHEARWIAERVAALHDAGSRVVRGRRALPDLPAVHAAAAGVRGA